MSARTWHQNNPNTCMRPQNRHSKVTRRIPYKRYVYAAWFEKCIITTFWGFDNSVTYRLWSVPGNQNMQCQPKIVPKLQKKNKVQKITWRCFKNNESITPGLMFDHKSHMSHVYTSHRNSARASFNGCISLTLHQKFYLRNLMSSNIQCLSTVTFKINFWDVLVKL